MKSGAKSLRTAFPQCPHYGNKFLGRNGIDGGKFFLDAVKTDLV